tara:strand:+ start:922 stop:1203 length:282 start_codon:yes stop_codon:yes gene_type:complete
MSSIPSPNCNQSPEKKVKKKKKKSKNRCALSGCKKKLCLASWACKCERKFCVNHRPASKHACSFDWRNQHADFIKKNLEKGKSVDTKNFVGIC